MLVNWRAQILRQEMNAVIKLRDELRTTAAFRGAIHIAEPGLQAPEESLRQAAMRALEARGHQPAPIALVVLGGGFGASAIRSVCTGVFALRGAPTRLFANVDEAAEWMSDAALAHGGPEALAASCRRLREVTK